MKPKELQDKENISDECSKVISLDTDKIRFTLQRNHITGVNILVVEKKTKELEMRRILRLANWLPFQAPLRVRNTIFQICVPKIISWNEKNSTLHLEHHEGFPIECLLKRYTQGKERTFWIEFIEKFFTWCNEKGLIWDDCAPRNMLVNIPLLRLTLVDFERRLCFRNRSISFREFQYHAQDLIFEEFAAFLFPREQRQIFSDIWSTYEEDYIDKKSITSRRKKLLLEKKFGLLPQKIPAIYVNEIGKLMADVATPSFYQGKAVFPMELLEKIAQKGGTEGYVKTVLRIEKKSFPKRISVLKEIAKRLEC